jgi:hypothetical protein
MIRNEKMCVTYVPPNTACTLILCAAHTEPSSCATYGTSLDRRRGLISGVELMLCCAMSVLEYVLFDRGTS